MASYTQIGHQPVSRRSEMPGASDCDAWVHRTAEALQSITLATPSTVPLSTVRGTTVSLSIPLDERGLPNQSSAAQAAPVSAAAAARGGAYISGAAPPHPQRREPVRRDSLKRRESLLKGKEGSRRRQRWENDHLASNPHAQPPLPSDWEVRPTYPRHATVPYNLAQLWDEKFSRQAAAREQAAAEARRANALRAYSSSAGLGAGDCPSGAAKTHAAKCVRELKDARPPRGLLQDLEEEIRQFVQAWQAQRASAAAKPKTRDEDDEITSDSSDDDNGIAIESDDEEEVVFVGRKYRSSDAVGRATATATTMRAVAGTTARASVQHHRYQQYDTGSGTGRASLSSTPNKLIVHSPLDDRNASFRRWLVHVIANYYGLRTWSVTVGNPARREAYIGIDHHTGVAHAERFAHHGRQQLRQPTNQPSSMPPTAESFSSLPRPLWVIV